MDYETNVELQRETIFQDAVLSQAEARGMEIIASAGKNRTQQLEQAYRQCDEASYEVVKAQMEAGGRHNLAAYVQKARGQLLLRREELVEDLFAEVQRRVAAFTQSGAYPAYLEGLLQKHADMLRKGFTLYLRAQDMALGAAIQKAHPGLEVEASPRILLGGLALGDGHILYDETLDEAMRGQREAFYASGRLAL